MATYFIATTGSDSNPGSEAQPWLTPQYAANQLRAGDTLTYRGGTYTTNVSYGYTYDGTAAAHVTINAYAGETVIFDGGNNPAWHGSGNGFIQIYGDYYDISDVTVRYSGETGLVIFGDHSTATRVTAHHSWSGGIYATGDYDIIDDCDAYLNSIKNENGALPISWSFGISLCRYPTYGVIRNCRSWNNWGEGISTFEGYHNTLEDNVVWDNYTVNIYVSDSQYAKCRRNLSYYTPGNLTQAYCSSQNALRLGDEGHTPASSDNEVTDNICMGGDRCFSCGGTNMNGTLVAHNTFVDAFNRIGVSEAAAVYFNSGSSTGGEFKNNIISENEAESAVLIAHLEATGIAFNYNNWSRQPVAGARGANDVNSDPLLARQGSTAAGELTADYFRLTATSPGKDAGVTGLGVDTDYYGYPRYGAPDMGALEIQPPSVSVNLQNALLDHVFKTAAYTPPTNIYIALSTSTIDSADTGGSIGGEVTGKGYARVTCNTWDAADAGYTENTGEVTFAEATADWGTITDLALVDGATTGNVLVYGKLVSPLGVEEGDVLMFPEGTLQVRLT